MKAKEDGATSKVSMLLNPEASSLFNKWEIFHNFLLGQDGLD